MPARTCVHARARRRWRRRRPAGAGLGLGLGTGTGTGLGSGSGFGFGFPTRPGSFESGLTGMGCEHTRSAIRTGPPTDPLRYSDSNPSSWTANSCDCWVEPLQRFRPNRCNLSLDSDPLAPPGDL